MSQRHWSTSAQCLSSPSQSPTLLWLLVEDLEAKVIIVKSGSVRTGGASVKNVQWWPPQRPIGREAGYSDGPSANKLLQFSGSILRGSQECCQKSQKQVSTRTEWDPLPPLEEMSQGIKNSAHARWVSLGNRKGWQWMEAGRRCIHTQGERFQELDSV